MSHPAPEKPLEEMAVDSDTLRRLHVYADLLARWSKVKNLVSANTLHQVWDRHLLDSVQVQRALPEAAVWIDIGSGGGFPGLVTAILLEGRVGARVHLVEADGRKCAFLRAVSRETGAPASVHHGRIEAILPTLPHADAISARALAPVDQLIEWTGHRLLKGSVGVFPKGKGVQRELTRLSSDSRFELEMRPSISDPEGTILLVRATHRNLGAERDQS